MVSVASAPNRTESGRVDRVAEVSVMLDRILPEAKKNDAVPGSADPFKVLGLPYNTSLTEVESAFRVHARVINPEGNRSYSELDQRQLSDALKAVIWARTAAQTEIINGKATQRHVSATTPDPSNTAMGTKARDIANASMGVSRSGTTAVNAATGGGSGSGSGYTASRGSSVGGGPGHGSGVNHGSRGAGGGGGGGGTNVPHGHGAADESPHKKTIREISRWDALNDPLQAFVRACNPVVFQEMRESLVEFQTARLCGKASRDLGHRLNARELHYAVVGRNDKAYLESGGSWKTRDIGLAVAAGRLMQQEMLLRMTVRNDIQQKMRATGAAFGELGTKHIDQIYKGVGLRREGLVRDEGLDLEVYGLQEGNLRSADPRKRYGSVEFTGIMHEIMNHDHTNMRPANLPRGVADDEFPESNQVKFGSGDDAIILTREGIESIKNAVASVSYEAMQKIDFYELDKLWGMNGSRENWTDTSVALASNLISNLAYKNGLITGKFMLILQGLNSLAEGARAWR